jgi:subtilisin family serine protease
MRNVLAFALSLAASLAASQPAQVFVELTEPPALAPWLEKPGPVTAAALPPVGARLAAIAQEQEAFLHGLQERGVAAVELYRTSRLMNGVALEVPAASIPQLRQLAEVRGVYPIVPKRPTLASALPLVRAVQAWERQGLTGQGVRVGIIDTGVDYRHRTFGAVGSFPNSKVVGGYDFAGDSYDAGSNDPAKRTPRPDPDPMDCNGHGTHVASIVAGFGVTREGNPFPGPFGEATPLAGLAVPPGVAPGALLYALKVFGCSGSTGLVVRALDWAADPNGDGNPADHLDIVNLSLGSGYGSNDDADAVAANRAAQLGVLVVAAAGNDGDTTFIVSSPATATRALAVASSVDAGAVTGAFEVLAPADLAGRYPASEAAFGPDLAASEVEGVLAAPSPGEELGCNPFSPASASALAGRIALIERGECTFKRKVLNAQNAGALGVLVVRRDDGDPFTMGNDTSITSPITIPAQMTVLSVGNLLRARLGEGVRVRLTARFRNQFLYTNPAREDTVSGFSSRGPRGDLVLKPELAAPGETVFAAARGTTTQGVSLSGTSMATPVVAGVAALVKQRYPALGVQELKALLMNTADPFLYATTNGVEPRHRVSRVGAGRVNALRAASGELLLFATADPWAVAVSLGMLPAPGSAVAQVSAKNIGSRALTLEFGYEPTQELAGVAVGVTPQRITLAPGETTQLQVQVTTTGEVPVQRDPTQEPTQGDNPRFFLTELSGHLLAREGEEVLARLPLYGVLVPAGTLAPRAPTLASGTTTTLTLEGVATPQALVVPLQLAYRASSEGSRPGKVLFAGVASDAAVSADPTLTFGVLTAAPWVSPREVTVSVYLDLDRNGTPDVRLWNQPEEEKDVFWVAVCKSPPFTACTPHLPLGGLSPEGVHPPAFATNVMVLAARASEVGWSPGQGAFDFWVTASDQLGLATETPHVTFDPQMPGVAALVGSPGPLVLPAAAGSTLQVQHRQGSLLLLFPKNRPELRAQVLDPLPPSRPRRHLSRR